MSDPFISSKTKRRFDFIVNAIFVILIAAIVYLVFKYALSYVFPFIIALLLVAAINPLIKYIHKKLKINQKIMSVVMIALIYVLAGWLIFVIVAQIAMLLKDVIIMFPEYFQDTIAPALITAIASLENLSSELPTSWGLELESVRESLLAWIQNLAGTLSRTGISLITNFTNSIPSLIMNLIFTVLLSFFISVQYDKVLEFLKNQLPRKVQDFGADFKGLLKNSVLRYIKAYLILMVITFVEISIGLLILGTPKAVAIAAGIAIFDALPVFGTGAIMIPWIIIELFQGDISFGIGLAIVYGIVTIVRNIIEPKIVGDQLGINPIVSLMAIYLGYRMASVIGMIIFPILAQILITLHNSGSIKLYKEKRSST